MAKPEKREPKKPYAKPRLTVYGSVTDLTKKVGRTGQPDGGNPRSAKHTTHI